jgi:hypothetical protein
MTKKQLDAIRDRVETAHRNPGCCSTRVANDLRALLDEVERLHADPLPAARWVREVERAAFCRGAEAMRTALAQRVDWHGYMADIIRAEPVPEAK